MIHEPEAPPDAVSAGDRVIPVLSLVVALVPLAFSLGWLVFKDGGRSPGWLAAAEGLTFLAAIVFVFTGHARSVRGRGLRAALGTVAVAAVAAAASTLFSKEAGTSVPALVEWLWLGALALLVAVAAQHRRGRELLFLILLAALFAQVFWSYYQWWGSQDPSHAQVGTFFASNQFAGYVLLLAPLCLGVSLVARSHVSAGGAGFAAAFLYLAIVLSGSRAGALAAAVGALAMVALAARRRLLRTLVRVSVTAVFFVVIGVVITGPLLFPSSRTPGGPGAVIAVKGTDTTDLTQRARWDVGALEMGVRRPLTGWGLGTFGDALFQIQKPSWQWSKWAHDQYLEAFAEGGLLLALAVIALPAIGLAGGFAALRRHGEREDFWLLGLWGGLVGGSAHLLVDHDWSYPAYAAAFVVVAVLVLAPWGAAPRSPEQVPGPVPLPRATPWAVALVSVACLLVLGAHRESVRLLDGPSARNESRVHLATLLAPYDPAPRDRLGLLLAGEGGTADLERAAGWLRSAIARNQLSPSLRWDLAGVQVKQGDLAGARASFQEAISIDPVAAAPYLAAANFEGGTAHDPFRALAVLDEGIAELRQGPATGGQDAGVAVLRDARAQIAPARSANG